MMNKRKLLHLIVVVIGVFLLSGIVMMVKANTAWAVSVKPILPKNQYDSEVTYYDLRMIPSQKQNLQLELTNTSDTEQRVTIQINDATTNDDGDIDYSDRSKITPRDKSLKLSLRDVASVEPETTIPAKKTARVTVQLKMPETKFDGMILGGIKVVSSAKEKDTFKADDKNKQGTKTYIVAVKLTETDEPIEAKLNLLSVVPSENSSRNTIKATIQNDQAINLEEITFTAKVFQKGSDKLLAQTELTGCRMAPNSNFSFTIEEEKKEFQEGLYQIHLTAKSEATNQEWEWDKELEIKNPTEKKAKSPKYNSEKDKITVYIIICVSTFILLLVFLIILLITRNRKERRYKEALSHRKKKQVKNKKNTQRKKNSEGRKRKNTRKKRPIESRQPQK